METLYIVLGIVIVGLIIYYFTQKGKKEISPEESTQIPSEGSEMPSSEGSEMPPSEGPEA